ncbi:hypothetical protein EDB84DRAFT_1542941, partial [Lactarius hengduanensis]
VIFRRVVGRSRLRRATRRPCRARVPRWVLSLLALALGSRIAVHRSRIRGEEDVFEFENPKNVHATAHAAARPHALADAAAGTRPGTESVTLDS